jgi:RNA polymerase sigma-70 factor (ECF subfamily)
MAADEHAAITQLKHGDIRGLETLVRHYQLRAVRAAYLITHDRAQAEDIVRAAFIRAYERIAQFDETRPFGPWFLRSVINDASKAVTRGQRVVPLPGVGDDDTTDDLSDPQLGPEELLLRAESHAAVWAALETLPVAQRRAVVLRYYLDLPEAEAASQLGIAPGTAKSRLHNARKRLHGALASWKSGESIEGEDRPPSEPAGAPAGSPSHRSDGSTPR